MKVTVALLVCCFTVAFGYKYEDSFLEHAKTVNDMKTTWKAGFNYYFAGKDWIDVKKTLGTLLDRPVGEEKFVPVKDVLPDTFDARDHFASCKSTISHIRDQATCGSCWAVSAAIVATDRTCVATNGQFTKPLSAEDVLACCGFTCGQGCQGGYPIQAMKYWARTGLVTGGDYNDISTCAPYEIAPCSSNCQEASTPQCVRTCKNGASWTADKHKAQSGYYVTGGADAIRQEILSHGPVQAAFSVYADFMHYQSGVYQHVTGALEGGHAVTIIGWGTENSTPYWLVKNQWNTSWGDQGLFKIKRGSNECGFEAGVVAGIILLEI